MGENTPSVSDIRAVMDASNGSNGFAYPYPVYANNGFGGNGAFGNGDSWVWLILILALFGGFGGNNWGNGFGGNGFNNEYAWLSNGQKEIMQNTTNGFDSLQLGNQIGQIATGVNNLSTQLCNCCSDISQNLCNNFANTNQTINSGFANAETSANARQMANMQQSFNNQIATLQGFNGITSQLCDASAENRLGQANLTSTILSENCADRAALQEGVRDIITASQNNTQKIIDEIFKDRLDEKDDKIAELNRQLQLAELKSSQTAQNAFIANSLNNEIDLMYNRLVNCPIPSTPVYGRTPIFNCNGNNGCGCGCGNVYGNTIV